MRGCYLVSGVGGNCRSGPYKASAAGLCWLIFLLTPPGGAVPFSSLTALVVVLLLGGPVRPQPSSLPIVFMLVVFLHLPCSQSVAVSAHFAAV